MPAKTKGVVLVFALLALAFQLGCQKVCSHGLYKMNMRVVEKGKAKVNGSPQGMTAGTQWLKGGNGYLRFKGQDKEVWEEVQTGKYYVLECDCQGWLLTVSPSSIKRDYVIIGD